MTSDFRTIPVNRLPYIKGNVQYGNKVREPQIDGTLRERYTRNVVKKGVTNGDHDIFNDVQYRVHRVDGHGVRPGPRLGKGGDPM